MPRTMELSEPLAEPSAEQGNLWSFCCKELRTMWGIGWPMLVSFFCRMGMASEDSAFVGHISGGGPKGVPLDIGRMSHIAMAVAISSFAGLELASGQKPGGYSGGTYLAAVGLSDMATNILIMPPLAFNQSLNALVSQAMGSGNLKMAGTWLQLAVFWLTIAYIPCLVSFFYVEEILTVLGFDADICALAGLYAKFNVLWPIPNGWYQCMRFYFQAQKITKPAMFNNIAFLCVNCLLNWIFVFGGPFRYWCGWEGFGFVGAAISLSCSRSLQPLAYWLYMFAWRDAHQETWPGWSRQFLERENMKTFMSMSLPQMGTLIMQSTIGQATVLLIARLGPDAIAASSAAVAVTQVFTGGLLATLTAVAGVRVGFYLGKGEGKLANRAGWLACALGAIITACIALFLVPLSQRAVAVVTNDPVVQSAAAPLIPAVLLNTMAGIVVQCGTGGILTSQGRTFLVTFLSFGFELPFTLGSVAILVIVFHSTLQNVYWAQAIVTILEAIVVMIIVSRSDWDRYSREVRARQNVDAVEPDKSKEKPGMSMQEMGGVVALDVGSPHSFCCPSSPRSPCGKPAELVV